MARMLEVVHERGELERTVIVYSSDHGEMLGDHGRWGKTSWLQASAGVPLVVAGPGVRRGAESDALVSTHDLAATFLEMAGAAPLPGMDSTSLVPHLTGRSAGHRDFVRSGLDEWRLVWDGTLKLVQRAEDGGVLRTLLYDLEADP